MTNDFKTFSVKKQKLRRLNGEGSKERITSCLLLSPHCLPALPYFFFLTIKLFLFLAVLGFLCCVGFSLAVERLLSGCGVRASHCGMPLC